MTVLPPPPKVFRGEELFRDNGKETLVMVVNHESSEYHFVDYRVRNMCQVIKN